jgi:hypothetical protein
MEAEHCSKVGCLIQFTTGNYGVTTTPRREWNIVLGLEECDMADMKDRSGNIVRRIPKIRDLKEMALATDSKLVDAEIIAVVLYTGPMVLPRPRIIRYIILFNCLP